MAGLMTLSRSMTLSRNPELATRYPTRLTDWILRLPVSLTSELLTSHSCQKGQQASNWIKFLFRNRRMCLKFKRNSLTEAKAWLQIQLLPTTCLTLLDLMVYSRRRPVSLNLQVSKLIKHIHLKWEWSITRQPLNGCTFCHPRRPISKSVTRKKGWCPQELVRTSMFSLLLQATLTRLTALAPTSTTTTR